VRLALKLSPAALYSDVPGAAIRRLQGVLDREQMSPGERGELRYWISRLRCQTGDTGGWRDEMQRAAGELQRRPGLAARAMVNLAWPGYGDEPLEHHLAWLDRAVQMAARADDRAVKIAVLSQRASILMCVGDPGAWSASEDIPPAADLPEERLQLLRAYHSLAVMALGLGCHGRAQWFLDQATFLDEELDHAEWGRWRESVQASLDARRGSWEGLEPRVRALVPRTASRSGISTANEMVLASLLLGLGRVEEAKEIWSSILQRSMSTGWTSSHVTASAGLARAHLALGDAPRAHRAALAGVERVRRKAIWCWGREVVPAAVQAALACGWPAEARRLSDEFAVGLAGRCAPAARAASDASRAAIAEAAGDHVLAARLFASAERAWGSLPSPYEETQALEARAKCLLAQGEAGSAPLLRDAVERFEGLGASRDAARARGVLKQWGLAAPPVRRRGRPAYGNELSPREVEVARLAGKGRKNREIAELLFISPRTVEDHVAAAIRKLGVQYRHELAAVSRAHTSA